MEKRTALSSGGTNDPGDPHRSSSNCFKEWSEKLAHLGIECLPELCWSQWSAKKDLEKQLIVKNVGLKPCTLCFRPPQSRCFSLPLPVARKIPPGITWSIPVTFRPHYNDSFEDILEIITENGCFDIVLRAKSNELALSIIPLCVEFGMVAIGRNAKEKLTVRNTGSVDVIVKWRAVAPFSIIPEIFSLPARESTTCKVTFRPAAPCTYTATAVCEMLLPLKEAVKTLCCTECHSAPPRTSESIVSTGLFEAASPNEKLKVVEGEGTSQIAKQGQPLKDFLQEQFCDIRRPEDAHEEQATRVVELVNASSAPAVFCFPSLHPESILQLNKRSGIVPPKSFVQLSLSLDLKSPCSFYHRAYCLVKGGPHPLPLDIVATCFSNSEYPARITKGHIILQEYATVAVIQQEKPGARFDTLGLPIDVPLPVVSPSSRILEAADGFPHHKRQVTLRSEASKYAVTWCGGWDGGVHREFAEALIYPSAQRSHQAVNPQNFVVPQLLQLDLFGCAVSPLLNPPEELEAALSLSEQVLRMPPCAMGALDALNSTIGQLAWQVVQLSNRGDSPVEVEFRLAGKAPETVTTRRQAANDLRIWPAWSRIPRGGMQLFVVLHAPSASSTAGRQLREFKLFSGGAPISSIRLQVYSTVACAKISVEENPILFQLAGVCRSVRRLVLVKNTGGVPVKVRATTISTIMERSSSLQWPEGAETDLERDTRDKPRSTTYKQNKANPEKILAEESSRKADRGPFFLAIGDINELATKDSKESEEFVLDVSESKPLSVFFSPKKAQAFSGTLVLQTETLSNHLLLQSDDSSEDTDEVGDRKWDKLAENQSSSIADSGSCIADARCRGAQRGSGQGGYQKEVAGNSQKLRVPLIGRATCPQLQISQKHIELGTVTVGTTIIKQPFQLRFSLVYDDETVDQKAVDLARAPADTKLHFQQQKQETLRLDVSSPLCTFLVSGVGDIPRVLLADVRSLSGWEAPFSLWQHFQAVQINKYLSDDLTYADLQFVSSDGLLGRRKALSLLPTVSCYCGFRFPRVGYVDGNPGRGTLVQKRLLLTFFNPGPTTAELRVLTDKYFQESFGRSRVLVKPSSLRLPPKGYRQILVELFPQLPSKEAPTDAHGTHTGYSMARDDAEEDTDVPLVLQVAQGKAVRLLLRTGGLNPRTPLLYAPPSIPGCLQLIELRNESEVPLQWWLPPAICAAAGFMNNGRPLLRFYPSEGFLGPLSAAYLLVSLTPSMAAQYTVPIEVQYKETEKEETELKTLSFCVSFTGCKDASQKACEDSKIKKAEDELYSLPISAAPNANVPLPLNAKLSRERIAFPPRPFRSSVHSLTALYNNHPSKTLVFSWNLSCPVLAAIALDVTPLKGVLGPGEDCLFWVTCRLPDAEAKLRALIRCDIIWADDADMSLEESIQTAPKPTDAVVSANFAVLQNQHRQQRRVTASSAASFCCTQIEKCVQKELEECTQMAERGPFTGDQPIGEPFLWKEPDELLDWHSMGGSRNIHDVGGPLFLLLEAEVSELLEYRARLTHRSPAPLPYVQRPHMDGSPQEAAFRLYPETILNRSLQGPQRSLQKVQKTLSWEGIPETLPALLPPPEVAAKPASAESSTASPTTAEVPTPSPRGDRSLSWLGNGSCWDLEWVPFMASICIERLLQRLVTEYYTEGFDVF
ncbi:hypothetical protein cyc_04118 [Cyclospora cayetanensis]|uniref:CFAP65 fourth Ig-like domain-containing protein n=1 Tax=Cyclospora cayetanensis TaxID=88456 RepID=A0A1D3D6A3_9EIME|nr:hypothetical protein cyc_04118 [Cyclospora cayetanensis]